MEQRKGMSGLAKFLIGCGVVVLVVGVIVCGGATYLGYKGVQAAKEIGESFQAASKEYTAIEAEHPFETPEDLTLTAEMIDEYFAVRRGMQARLLMVPAIKKLAETPKGQKPDLGIRDGFSLGTYAIAGVHADMAQELRAQGVPPSKYKFLTKAVYLTLQKGATESEDFKESLANLSNGLDSIEKQFEGVNIEANGQKFDTKSINGFLQQLADGNPVPPGNVELLRPHLEEFKSDMTMVLFDIIIYSFYDEEGHNWRRSAAPTSPPVPVEEGE